MAAALGWPQPLPPMPSTLHTHEEGGTHRSLFSSHTAPGCCWHGSPQSWKHKICPHAEPFNQTKLHPGQILASVPSHPPAHQSMHPQPHLAMRRAGATLHPSVLSMGTRDPFALKAQLCPSPGALGPQAAPGADRKTQGCFTTRPPLHTDFPTSSCVK